MFLLPQFFMRYWQETWAVAQRILTELVRRRRSLMFWCIFPVTVLWLNGLILAERAQMSQAQAFELAAPSTLVGAALFFSCLGGSVATVVAEREQRTLKRLFMSPLSGLSYFLGIFVAHGFIALGQTLIVAAIALFTGATFQGLFLGALIIVLSVMAYVGVGFILGTQFARRTEDVNALVAAFGVPLLILGGAFLPARFFPQVLLDIARFNPVYHMNEALTAAVAEGQGLDEMGGHLLFLALFALGVTIVGWLSYHRMLQVERRL
jgi:ABC-2 type transport system permease protein